MSRPKPAEQIVALQLRLPNSLWKAVAAQAKTNRRSLNSELLFRLELSFSPEAKAMIEAFYKYEAEIRRGMDKLVQELVTRHK